MRTFDSFRIEMPIDAGLSMEQPINMEPVMEPPNTELSMDRLINMEPPIMEAAMEQPMNLEPTMERPINMEPATEPRNHFHKPSSGRACRGSVASRRLA